MLFLNPIWIRSSTRMAALAAVTLATLLPVFPLSATDRVFAQPLGTPGDPPAPNSPNTDNSLNTNDPPPLGAKPFPGKGRKGGLDRMREALGLSEAQKEQIKTLREEQQNQIEALLTPEQKALLESMPNRNIQEGQEPPRRPGSLPDLKLTDNQVTKMAAILDSGRQKFESILTPAQVLKMERHRVLGALLHRPPNP